MRRLLLVGHGSLAGGFASVLRMLVGNRPDILSCDLAEGMAVDDYVAQLRQTIALVGEGDSLYVVGDVIGGTAHNCAVGVLRECGLLERAIIFGGLNLPMLRTAGMQPEYDDATLAREMLSQGSSAGRLLEP